MKFELPAAVVEIAQVEHGRRDLRVHRRAADELLQNVFRRFDGPLHQRRKRIGDAQPIGRRMLTHNLGPHREVRLGEPLRQPAQQMIPQRGGRLAWRDRSSAIGLAAILATARQSRPGSVPAPQFAAGSAPIRLQPSPAGRPSATVRRSSSSVILAIDGAIDARAACRCSSGCGLASKSSK